MAVRIHGTFGSWVLPRGASVLGRGSTCDVRIDDPRLSRGHARFVLDGHDLRVEDLGSRNGVLVDGRRIQGSSELRHGQVVVCGPAVLMVSIDPTQPHPRQPEGAQDPATRRTSAKGDTEAMLDAVSVSDRPSASSRGIDPAIFAAVASPTGQMPGPADASRQSALQPAAMPGSLSSPLEAVRPDPRAVPRPSTRRSPSTASLEAPSLDPTSTSALEAPTPTKPAPMERIVAGFIDGMVATGAAGIGLIVALLALAGALHLAGARIVDGAPSLVAGTSQGLNGLLLSLLQPGGLSAALELAQPAAAVSTAAMVLLVLGAAVGSMIVVGGLLIVLVVPTVTRGGPHGHRAYGLVVVRSSDGLPPGYGRAMLRWLLAALLAPLGLPAAMLRRRALHDVISGCTVRRG